MKKISARWRNLYTKAGFSSFMASLLAILCGLVVGFVVLLVADPANAFWGLLAILTGGLSDMKNLGQVLYAATPIILTGLSVGFANKTGLFNIGASGQFIVGAYVAVLMGVKCTFIPGPLLWLACLLGAMLAGAVWGLVPGFLKAVCNVNEVIACIMMNYIGMYGVNFLIQLTVFDSLKNQSLPVAENANAPKLGMDLIFRSGATASSANAGIFIAVHLEAKKLGLKGMPKSEMVSWGELAKRAYLIIPLALLIFLVSSGSRTMQFSAAVSILAAIVVGFLNKDERLTFGKIVEALEAGAKGAITVAVACAMAGMIAGCITVTGLASILINAIVQMAGDATMIGLLLTMICCIILGMGVPTTANYCIMASTCAPILVQMGFPLVAAHFFVFYFGIVADITPPVALAAYAGAAIAKANPMKTGINATKLAIAAFIVPYIFAYSPAMLFDNVSSAFEVVQIVVSALIGLFGVAAALNGFVYKKIPMLFRLAMAAGGLCMMIPGTASDVVGLVMVGGIVLIQRMSAQRLAA